MATNLILTGGVFHPFDTAAPALAKLLAAHGIESTISEDIEGGLGRVARGEFDLLTVYALRWTMTQHEKYAPHRARWALSLSASGREAILAHLRRGRGLFGLHTASICFDDWPGWRNVLGGAWVWGRSGHPPYGPATAEIERTDHPLTRGLGGFAIDDEIYGNQDLAADVVPLMRAAAGDRAAGWHPVLWARQAEGGRVAFDALGHDAASLEHPTHRRIVARAALWALGRPDNEVEKA